MRLRLRSFATAPRPRSVPHGFRTAQPQSPWIEPSPPQAARNALAIAVQNFGTNLVFLNLGYMLYAVYFNHKLTIKTDIGTNRVLTPKLTTGNRSIAQQLPQAARHLSYFYSAVWLCLAMDSLPVRSPLTPALSPQGAREWCWCACLPDLALSDS